MRRGTLLTIVALALGIAATPAGAVTLRPVDGGTDYYGRFPNSLPADAGYFPIGVWFESVTSQGDINLDKGAGLNTYVVLTGNSSLPLIAANGMKVLGQDEEWVSKANAPGSEAIAGWELWDEIDMQKPPEEAFAALRSIRAGLPAGDGRLRYNNYGKGVTFWNSDADAATFVNEFQDVVSADNYWFTDENICGRWEGGALLTGATRALTPAECHRAANYGATVDRLRRLVRPAGSKPVWAFVEVGHPYTEDHWPTIRPVEISAAVWSSLIHGARGIVYFNHSFGGPNETQHALREPAYAAARAEVTRTNARIQRLAPVLNAPFADGLVSTSAAVDTMAKYSDGRFYVFAASKGGAETATFSVPCTGDATVTVLDEDRTLPLTGGSFRDAFADGNAVHIYRIDGGSTCGLPADAGAPRPPGQRGKAWIGRGRLRSGRVIVPVRCAARCTVRSRLSIRTTRLAAARKRFGAGRHRLTYRVSKRSRRRIAKSRRRIVLRTTITEPGGPGARRTQRLRR